MRSLSEKYEIPERQLRKMKKKTGSRIQFIESFFKILLESTDKPRWGEKSPVNVLHLGRIFHYFPKAQFIHIIRDGRDTASSLRKFPRYKMVKGERIELDTNNPLEQCIKRWVHDVSEGMKWRSDPRYMEVKYEDLINNDEFTLKKIFEFLNEPWYNHVIKYIYDPKRYYERVTVTGINLKPDYK